MEETLGLRLCVRVEAAGAAGHVGRLREQRVVYGQDCQPRAKVRGDHRGVAERAARWLGKVDRTQDARDDRIGGRSAESLGDRQLAFPSECVAIAVISGQQTHPATD